MALGESAGVLFRIKGDASDALRALKNTEQATDKLTGTTKGLSATYSSFVGPASVAAAGITAIAASAAAAGLAMYQLAKSTSDYGSEIFDAAQKTGASTDALQALKFAAEQSGSSFEGVTNAVAKFNVLIGNAATGNEKAEGILKQYGITAKTTDAALVQAISTIAKMTDSTQQAAAAGALFKDRTGEILPVIKSFEGDLPGLIDKLKDLGLIMSREGVEAADAFGDQMDTLNKQLSGLGRTIGTELMPEFTKMAQDVGKWLAENPGAVKAWGESIAYVLRRVAAGVREAATNWEGLKDIIDTFTSADPSAMDAYLERAAKRDVVRREIANVVAGTDIRGQGNAPGDQYDEYANRFNLPFGGTQAGARDKEDPAKIKTSNIGRADSQAQVDAANRAREIRDVTAQITTESINLRGVIEGMNGAYEAIRDRLNESGGILGFTEATNEATNQWAGNLSRSLTFIEELERRQLKADALQSERDALAAQQQERRHKLKLEQDSEIKKNQDALFKAQNEQWDKQQKADADKAIADQARFDEEQKRMEARAAQSVTVIGAPVKGLTNPNADEEAGPFYLWTKSWKDFFDTVEQDAPVMQSLFADLGSIMQRAFLGLAQAIGAVVQQWVIYGNTGPAVMRKMLAAVLASVAAEAAVKAIMATAEGFYFLATHQYSSAANAFTAAGFYGAVAGVAALTGRAVAGNAFKQQTNVATGSAGGASRSSSGNQGEAYSGRPDGIYEMGRNQPSGNITLTLKLDSNGVLDVVKDSITSNGIMRGLIINTAGA